MCKLSGWVRVAAVSPYLSLHLRLYVRLPIYSLSKTEHFKRHSRTHPIYEMCMKCLLAMPWDCRRGNINVCLAGRDPPKHQAQRHRQVTPRACSFLWWFNGQFVSAQSTCSRNAGRYVKFARLVWLYRRNNLLQTRTWELPLTVMLPKCGLMCQVCVKYVVVVRPLIPRNSQSVGL